MTVFIVVSMQWSIFKKNQEEPEETIISIDLMSLPEPAKLEPEEKAAPPAPEKPEPVSAPKKPPQPPKALSKPTPPPRSVPEEKKPEPAVQEDVPPLPKEPKPEEVEAKTEAAAEEAPTPKPMVAPKPVKRPKPPVKKEVKKEPEKKPEQAKEEKPKTDFQSVLKNLVGPDAAEIPVLEENQSSDDKNNRQVPTLTQPPPVSAQFTTGELAALQNQLAGCWSILPGARNAQNLKIEVELEINPDRTVRSAAISDQGRYQSDPFFRAAADSALRALRNPNCSPLLLPEFKYDQWKNMIVVFDPKTMFR
jgi:hypothetical protein